MNNLTVRQPGVRVAPKNIKDIRYVVNQIKILFGIKDNCYVDIAYILETLGTEYLPQYNFEVVDDSDVSLKNKFAETYPSEKLIRVKESIYNKACEGEGQARFTLAHELGHLFLGHKPVFARSADKIEIWCDSEWQADVFAAEFLMQHDLVKNMNAKEIAISCGVSISAAQTRRNKLSKNNWQ